MTRKLLTHTTTTPGADAMSELTARLRGYADDFEKSQSLGDNVIGNELREAADKIESLMAERDALDQALRIRIWNDLRERGVSQDKAIIEIEEKMAATLSHSSPTKGGEA